MVAAVGVGGVASQTALGQILNIAPHRWKHTRSSNATNGWVTTAYSIAHASGKWSAMLATSIKGNHGFLT